MLRFISNQITKLSTTIFNYFSNLIIFRTFRYSSYNCQLILIVQPINFYNFQFVWSIMPYYLHIPFNSIQITISSCLIRLFFVIQSSIRIEDPLFRFLIIRSLSYRLRYYFWKKGYFDLFYFLFIFMMKYGLDLAFFKVH